MGTLLKGSKPIIEDQEIPSKENILNKKEVVYPDSDGKPMADNTKQFSWIVKIKENLERIFADNPHVFIAGDLLWYPIEGNNKIRIAPDVLVAIGRPKGDRGSYRTWEEGNLPPQVVIEILSPGNTLKEMANKLEFYDQYGVEEYYLYDPDRIELKGWIRSGGKLQPIEEMSGWISPNLRIRFEIKQEDLDIFGPDGERFLSTIELDQKYQNELQLERQQVAVERKRAETERQRAEKLAAKLRELGVELE
jgi:Uma2 family endonuclease